MGIGFRELLVILVIALLIFGAKRLRTIGTDLGAAVRGFKKSMNEGESEELARTIPEKLEADRFGASASQSQKDKTPNDAA